MEWQTCPDNPYRKGDTKSYVVVLGKQTVYGILKKRRYFRVDRRTTDADAKSQAEALIASPPTDHTVLGNVIVWLGSM